MRRLWCIALATACYSGPGDSGGAAEGDGGGGGAQGDDSGNGGSHDPSDPSGGDPSGSDPSDGDPSDGDPGDDGPADGSSDDGPSTSDGGDPDEPAPDPPAGGPYQGFGAGTPGGEGGTEIHVTEATQAAVADAIEAANDGNAIVIFDVGGPIAIDDPLPTVSGSFITIDGQGVTLDGSGLGGTQALLDIRGHDVIVENLRLRNGGDNLRAQEDGAYNIVFSHISSTGAYDDGISIGYGAHDVTVQWCFLGGNTRSIFIKYDGTTDVTVHHTWILKQWIRGPLINAAFVDLRNLLVEDWTLWASRFEEGAQGNAVHSVWRLSEYARSLGGKPDSTVYAYSGSSPDDVFVAGNVYDGEAAENDGIAGGAAAAEFDAPDVDTHTGDMIEPAIREGAGCLPRDAVDEAYIDAEGWDVGDGDPLVLP